MTAIRISLLTVWKQPTHQVGKVSERGFLAINVFQEFLSLGMPSQLLFAWKFNHNLKQWPIISLSASTCTAPVDMTVVCDKAHTFVLQAIHFFVH